MLKKIRNTLRDLLFPLNYTCDLCGREVFGTNLCADCAKTVTFNNKTTCPRRTYGVFGKSAFRFDN